MKIPKWGLRESEEGFDTLLYRSCGWIKLVRMLSRCIRVEVRSRRGVFSDARSRGGERRIWRPYLAIGVLEAVRMLLIEPCSCLASCCSNRMSSESELLISQKD